MAKFYVSVDRGSDATGDGSATNPWKTIGKAIGSPPAVALEPANPNTLYIEPGVYRETVTLGVAPTAAGPLAIKGDGDGGGFAAGGYATPKTGLVDWRAWSDDSTDLLNPCLKAAGVNYTAVSGIKFIGGRNAVGSCIDITSCLHWSVSVCELVSGYTAGGLCMQATAGAGQTLDLAVDRCIFFVNLSNQPAFRINSPFNASEWDLGVTVRNSLFLGAGFGVQAWAPAGGGISGGGIAIQSCTFIGLSRAVDFYFARTATITSRPCTVYGCVVLGGGLSAGPTALVTADGNQFFSATPYTNVTGGVHSRTGDCPSFDFGDWLLTGLSPKPIGQPSYTGTISGFGNYGTVPGIDLTGRNRPEGAGSILASAGCLERHDTGVKNVIHQDAGSSACMALVGPSSQERPVLVDARPTALSVKVRWDGNHGDANKPQAVLVAEPQIGVAGQTVTATSTGGTGSTPNGYETLTFAPFTPTSPGVVMLRMISRAAAGNGAAYFDTITL